MYLSGTSIIIYVASEVSWCQFSCY